MEFSSLNVKNFFIFSQKKAFLIFREMELFKKTSYISGGNFSKNFLIISEMELSSPRFKKFLVLLLQNNFLMFQEGTCKVRKTNIFFISANGTF